MIANKEQAKPLKPSLVISHREIYIIVLVKEITNEHTHSHVYNPENCVRKRRRECRRKETRRKNKWKVLVKEEWVW